MLFSCFPSLEKVSRRKCFRFSPSQNNTYECHIEGEKEEQFTPLTVNEFSGRMAARAARHRKKRGADPELRERLPNVVIWRDPVPLRLREPVKNRARHGLAFIKRQGCTSMCVCVCVCLSAFLCVFVCDLIGLDGTSWPYTARNKPGSGPELQR